MDAEYVYKSLKTFNLTTANAVLMKRITIMHLHESVNRKALRARNSVFYRNAYKFLDYIRHALPGLASLVKFLYKFNEKLPKIGPK